MIKRPITLLVLLTALNFVNYLDRYVLAAVLPRVQADLHLSSFQAGLLYTIFLSTFLVTCPVFGILGDKMPRKYLLAFGALVWSVATFASGLAESATALFVARAFVGFGEASFTTLAPTVIDDLAPPSRRGRWLSIFYLAAPIGSALGYIVGGAVEARHGWHASFFVAGIPGLLLGGLVLMTAETKRALNDKVISLAEALHILKRIPLFWKGVAGYTAQTFSVGAFAVWAPSFLFHRFALRLDKANFVFGLVTVVGGAIATLVGGQLGDRLKRAENESDVESPHVLLGLLKICALGGVVAAIFCAAAFLAPGAALFFALAFLCMIGAFLANAPINTVLLRSVPKAVQGRAMAISILSIHLFGDLGSPAILGLSQDLAGPSRMALAMMPLSLVFALSALLWWPFKRETASSG
jgi:MFS transporter, Spinster family, sphingosine-1-phosphate transporter